MESRFGFKDFVLIVLVVAVGVLVVLAMVQFDRQWTVVQQIQSQSGEIEESQQRLRTQLIELRRMLERGVVAARPANGGAGVGADPGELPEGYVAPEVDAFARIASAREVPAYAEGDWVIDAFGANVAKITPLVSTDVYSSTINGYVLESLAERDPESLEWIPRVARGWSISDDGMTMRFKLREDVVFSDGEPLTAEDVVFSYDIIMNDDVAAPRLRAYYKDIEAVEALGDFEVEFRFAEPYFNSFSLAAGMEILPKHFYEPFLEDNAEQFNQLPGLLMGSGPYRMADPASWTPGQPLELLRNRRYWGPVRPAFERIVFKEINNDIARLTEFTNGEIDIFPAQPEQYLSLADNEDLMARTQFFEYERANGGYGFIGWNQKRRGRATPFADPRVRKAMTMLTNREHIANEVLLGYGIIPTGPFNRLSPQYNDAIEPWPYDPERALELLAEAGWRDRDGDGLLEDDEGEVFEFEITFPSSEGGGGFWDKVMLALKDWYGEAGILVELNPLEWAVFSEKLGSRDFDAICLAWGGVIESDPYQIFHSSQIGEGGDNFVSFSDPKLDELIVKARRTIDDEARMELWQEAHTLFHELQPYTFLYTRKSLVFVDGRFRNVQRVTMGLNDRREWFTPADLQKH